MSSILIHTLEICLVSGFMYLAWLMVTLPRADNAFDANAGNTVLAFDSTLTLSGLFQKPVKKKPQRSKTAEESAQFTRIDSLSRAQIFAGLQLFELKRANIDLASTKEWLSRRIAEFFIGASDNICEHFNCDPDDRHDVCVFVLTRNLGTDKFAAEKMVSEVRNAQAMSKLDNFDAYHAGSKAALSWLSLKYTPKSESLVEQIQNWGLIS